MTEMVCSRVMGNDVTVAIAARGGQLELNVMMPLIAAVLCESLQILTNAVRTLTTRCVEGITADAERCREFAERSVALPTVLNPILGYHAVADIVRESLETGESPRAIILKKKLLPPHDVDRIFSAKAMANVKPREGTP
jgi:aspartate ammonia-lyase